MNRRVGRHWIRDGTVADASAVLELWGVADAPPSVTDSTGALRALLAFDPQALLVVEAGGEAVGSLIAAWNGWRGSFYRLAVHPEHRRRGLGMGLVREGEKRLRERGATRIDAIVAADETIAVGFWSAVGYARQRDRSRFVRNL